MTSPELMRPRPKKCAHELRALGCCVACGAGERFSLDDMEALAWRVDRKGEGEIVELDCGEVLAVVDAFRSQPITAEDREALRFTRQTMASLDTFSKPYTRALAVLDRLLGKVTP